MKIKNKKGMKSSTALEVPASLKALRAAAEGYKYYMNYLKNGGSSGLSPELPTLEITGL